MRNLSKYPITKEEKLSIIDRMIEQERIRVETTQVVGDITITGLMAIRQDIVLTA
jgi:hypothetical protein